MTVGRAPMAVCLLGSLVLTTASCGRRATPPFALKGGERIVFLGDSITQAGLFATYVEAYLLTRFPDRRFKLHNHGLIGESVSAAGGPGRGSRRPNALRRFTRDVTAWRPSRVVACFGMNDGQYRPFEPALFDAFRAGISTLAARTRDEARARLVLLTPPPFDPYRRVVGDASAREFGYDYPAIDYDETLDRYARWLVDRRGGDVEVADAHSLMVEHLRRRRQGDVSFALTGDGVHPDETGHWLMAQALLLCWNAPATVAEARIDAASLKPLAGDVGRLEWRGDELVIGWRTGLPMPIDPAWDRRSLALERVADRLNRYRIAVAGLPAPRYRLLARLADDPEDAFAGEFERDELARGVDLTALEAFPTVALAARVLALLVEHRRDEAARWREQVAAPGASGPAARGSAEDDVVMTRIRSMCRPRELRLRLVPRPGAGPQAGTPGR